MKLHFREIGEGKSLLILHGLYGSGENWLSVAKALSPNSHIILPDLRNHGLSFHHKSHRYQDISEDILKLLKLLNIEKTSIIAHSMGGKAAMLFAFNHPEMIDKLIIIDIAAKNYNSPEYSENLNWHNKILSIFVDIDLKEIKSYSQLNTYLDKYSLDENEKQLFAKNLKKNKDKNFEWKLNIDAIKNNLDNILDFEIEENKIYNKECYFIKGEESNYLKESDFSKIKEQFPLAIFYSIPRCGHSPHRDKAEYLTSLLKNILLSKALKNKSKT